MIFIALVQRVSDAKDVYHSPSSSMDIPNRDCDLFTPGVVVFLIPGISVAMCGVSSTLGGLSSG